MFLCTVLWNHPSVSLEKHQSEVYFLGIILFLCSTLWNVSSRRGFGNAPSGLQGREAVPATQQVYKAKKPPLVWVEFISKDAFFSKKNSVKRPPPTAPKKCPSHWCISLIKFHTQEILMMLRWVLEAEVPTNTCWNNLSPDSVTGILVINALSK